MRRYRECCLLVICLYLIIKQSSGATVRLSGSAYAVLGQTFRFTCTVTGDTTPTLGTVAFSRGTTQVSYSSPSCGNPGGSDPGYSSVTCGSSGVYYLDISSVGLQDATTWTCARRSDNGTFILPVYYGPYNNMTLDMSSPQPVTESSSLTVTCSATCNPCSYTWKKGTTVSISRTLSLTNINRNQAGDYICTATNTQTGSAPRSTTLTVIVQYPPEVSLDTPSGTSSCRPYIVYVGQQNVQLTCRMTAANPTVTSYIWTHNGSLIPSATSSVYSLTPVSKFSGGSYTCAGRNSVGTSSSPPSLQVDAQYAPSLNLSSAWTVIEEQTLAVTCSVDSNPTASVTWTRKDGGSLPPQSGSTLTITNTQRSQTGTYVCTATNTLFPCSGAAPTSTPVSKEVTVDVQYKPTISGMTSSYPVTESSLLNINCSGYTTPGNPNTTTYKWTGPNFPTSTGPVLSIASINRTLTGQYNCTATNNLTPTVGPSQTGTATGQFNVDVQYPAVITAYTINSNTSTVTVNESYPVTMRCQVESNPRSTIRLYNGSRELSRKDNSLTHEHIWKADCRQRGNYSCTAGNNIGSSGTDTRIIQLVVTCSPRIDETDPLTPKYASSVGSDITLSVTVLSYPEPTFVWRKTSDSSQRNLTSLSSVKHVSDVSITASLTLTSLQEEDFGEYRVQVDNEVGQSADYILQLDPQGKPSPPANLTIINQGPNSIEVAWKQGFNGGGDQIFRVEYSTDDSNWKEAGTHEETGFGRYLQMNITNLTPQTVYYVRVAARNDYGTSYTNSIRVLTLKEIAESTPGALIAGVTVGCAAILVAIIVVVILVRRNKNGGGDKGPITGQNKRNGREEEMVLEENVCYVGSGDVSGACAAGGSDVYAVVNKKSANSEHNPHDVYATSTKKQKMKENDDAPFKKGKHLKRKGDEYENTAIADSGNPYINHAFDSSSISPSDEAAAAAGEKSGRDEDGCMYVGIDFGDQKPSTSVHKEEESTEYSAIKIGVIGPPLKEDDDEKKSAPET